MAGRPNEVANYVHEVVQAYDKAVNLVQRIEDRKDAKNDPEAVRDLYKSLALGPRIVQGYFDADSKRLGPAYTTGDYDAQLQLRDVLLSLRTLVGELSEVLLDDKEIDFRQLQDASDNCRVNAGVCLGQLSQRLAATVQSHFQPPPQYMSGLPPMGSPGLHYSSSRSTHSSSGRTMPRTPEPFYAPQALNLQWQPKRQEPEEQYYTSHQRHDTETDLRDSYANSNWSDTSQLFTERDADELSMRRPSSHTLAPEDGALLSPVPSDSRHGQQGEVLPGQQDLTRDSYTSFTVAGGSPVETRQHSHGLQQNRLRYGPDDYSPRLEQHGPFYIDRDSTQSVTSFANRSKHSTTASESDHRQSAQPEPLRLPFRSVRQFSNDMANPPPRKPIPPVPYDQFTGHQELNKHTDIPVKVPSQVDGRRAPLPPRSDSRPSPMMTPQQRLQSPAPTGPPFQPSPAVQQAMQRNALRQQYQNDRSAQQTSQPSSGLRSRTSSNTMSQQNQISAQPPYPGEQMRHRQYDPSQYPIPAQNTAQTQSVQKLSPQISRTQQQSNLSTQHSRAPSVKAASVTSVPVPAHLPLTLPDEKNTSPYCKGAFRLFLGLSKKTFIQAQRPVGLTGSMPYWRCDKCLFEGPMATMAGPLDKKGRPGKPERVFDQTIRECGPLSTAAIGPDGRGEGAGGIRFKWAFLAKCHVPQKSAPDDMGKPNGTFGSYGCLFCTAEGAGRGWTTTLPGDAASTLSGKSGNSGSSNPGSTPVFGNLQLFMDHLQMHRREENWPCPEMRGRMKCVIGRVADKGEEWEVNFLPL